MPFAKSLFIAALLVVAASAGGMLAVSLRSADRPKPQVADAPLGQANRADAVVSPPPMPAMPATAKPAVVGAPATPAKCCPSAGPLPTTLHLTLTGTCANLLPVGGGAVTLTYSTSNGVDTWDGSYASVGCGTIVVKFIGLSCFLSLVCQKDPNCSRASAMGAVSCSPLHLAITLTEGDVFPCLCCANGSKIVADLTP